MYRISVLSHDLKKHLKNKNNHYKRQELQFSHLSEINITFKTKLDHMTYRHYFEQPMPMVERLINRKLYKKYDLIKTLDGIDLTLHMGAGETGKADIYYSRDEDRLVFMKTNTFIVTCVIKSNIQIMINFIIQKWRLYLMF